MWWAVFAVIFSSSSPCKDTSLCFFASSSASVWFFSFWSLVGVELLVAFRRCDGGDGGALWLRTGELLGRWFFFLSLCFLYFFLLPLLCFFFYFLWWWYCCWWLLKVAALLPTTNREISKKREVLFLCFRPVVFLPRQLKPFSPSIWSLSPAIYKVEKRERWPLPMSNHGIGVGWPGGH